MSPRLYRFSHFIVFSFSHSFVSVVLLHDTHHIGWCDLVPRWPLVLQLYHEILLYFVILQHLKRKNLVYYSNIMTKMDFPLHTYYVFMYQQADLKLTLQI